MMDPAEQQDLVNTLPAGDVLPDPLPPKGTETRDVTILIRFTDPAMQALLDRVWAPYWRHLPPEALDDPHNPFPGRELARQRRQQGLEGAEP